MPSFLETAPVPSSSPIPHKRLCFHATRGLTSYLVRLAANLLVMIRVYDVIYGTGSTSSRVLPSRHEGSMAIEIVGKMSDA